MVINIKLCFDLPCCLNSLAAFYYIPNCLMSLKHLLQAFQRQREHISISKFVHFIIVLSQYDLLVIVYHLSFF